MLLYRPALKIVVLVLLVVPLGCGGEEAQPTNLVVVTGTVKYKGKPLSGAALAFVPKGQTTGTGAFSVTDASGRYELTHRTQSPGVEPGTYVVSVSKMALPDGSPIPEGQDAADIGAVQIIPPIYSDPANELNPNQITVPVAGGEINLDLK